MFEGVPFSSRRIASFADEEDARQYLASSELAAIGAQWRKDSSLEKWFPLTALELAGLRPRYKQLYELVEAYLCTPNNQPAIEDHYKALVAWFVRNKRPDGSEPRPVSPEQDLSV